MQANLTSAAPSVRIYPDGRMDAKSAVAYTGLSYKTMAVQRSQGVGPPFIKLGKSIFYRKDDLDAWLNSCRVASTSEYRAKNKRGMS